MHLTLCLKSYPMTKCQVLQNYRGFLKHYTFQRTFTKKPPRKDGGMNLAPEIHSHDHNQSNRFTVFMKSFSFTAGFCCAVFSGVSIWHYEKIKSQIMKEQKFSEWIKTKWNKMEGYEHKTGGFRQALNRWWNQLHDGEKIFWAICMINIFVFLCWRYPPLQSTMMSYFCSSPVGRVICWPMILSTFSHYAPFHLIMNMYVLNSFSGVICNSLGSEQFVGFYLVGGIISSFISHSFKLMTYTAGPSLGASGAIMAVIGYFCSKYPDAKLGIIFIPNFPISAELALKGIMLLDLLGLIFRWRLFDHAAHLGGAVFGILYALHGQSAIWGNRHIVTKVWDDLNNYISKRDK